jgi:uncharacterized protein
LRHFFLALSLAVCAGLPKAHAAAPPIPPAPSQYVYDEAGVLPQNAFRAVDALLIEHDRTTGQQILVAIFKSLDGEELNDRTNEVFKKWGIGQRGKDNGALLALYWNEHQARIEVGYGLEDQLTDARSKHILSDFLIPELKAGHPERAIPLATYQMLVAVDSPLIANGLADRILRGEAHFQGGFNEVSSNGLTRMSNGYFVWLVLGLILMTILGNIMSSAEAHFTGSGWFRPKPWQRGNWGNDGTSPRSGGAFPVFIPFPRSRGGGGLFGGDGGGFLGGGGSSGGGGASGGW